MLGDGILEETTTTGSAKDGTSGILYSVSTFSSDRSVANGDTINVTPTMSC